MSSFGTGSITGGVNFDMSQFTAGIGQAIAQAGTFPGAVASGIDAPLASVGSVVADASNSMIVPIGLAIGAFAAVGAAIKDSVGMLAEWTASAASAGLQTALLADKAGVSVHAFSELEQVGKFVSVSAQDISNGFRQIQIKAQEAAEGNKAAQKAFRDLHIPMQFVRANLDDMEKLFGRVREKMITIPTSAERTRRSMELLGRSGENLKPLLGMDPEMFNKFAKSATDMGVVQTETTGKLAKDYQVVSTEFDNMWQGLKKEAGEKIMQIFVDSWDTDIKPALAEIRDIVGTEVTAAIKMLGTEAKAGFPHLKEFADWLKKVEDGSNGTGVAVHALITLVQGLGTAFEKISQWGTAIIQYIYDDPEKSAAAYSKKSATGWKGSSPMARSGEMDADKGVGDVYLQFDPDSTARQIAEKVKPAIDAAHQKMQDQVQRQTVAHAAGGR